MAATQLTIKDLSSGALLDLQAIEQQFDAIDGAQFENTGDVIILIRNSGATPHVVTAVTPRTVSGGLAVADQTFTIATLDWAALPALDPNYFNDSGGKVQLQTDGTRTEVKAVAIKK